ncbi:MAG: HAD family hydrolase [Kineosporiaceae bacterium]
MSLADGGGLLGGVVPELVALDIDGTVLGYDGTLHPSIPGALEAALAADVHVVLATGREVHSTLPVTQLLGLTQGHAVCSNGAVTIAHDAGAPEGFRVVRSVTFDPGPALGLLAPVFPDAVFAVERPGGHLMLSGAFPEGELYGRWEIVAPAELTAQPVSRLVARAPHRAPEEFWPLVQRAGLHGVSFTVGYTAWLDIGPAGVSKASALQGLCEQLGVDPGETVAVGDWRNDLEMLRWAGRGIAMGQAHAEIQEAADAVTLPVEDGGVAQVLRAAASARASAV